MFCRCSQVLSVLLLGALSAHPQGMMSDMMSGKLVNPEVGAFAWYTLSDSTTQQEFYLRQAIVGTERVKRKDAYWLETELVPKVGFPSVYKMLLTGPASNPKNVHRLVVREGQGLVQEVEVDRTQKEGDEKEVPQTSAGMETITYPGGEIEAEHFIMEDGDLKTEIWVSDKVRPMGLVKMKTPQGELLLQRFGVGGADGDTAMPARHGEEEIVDESDTSDSRDSKQPRTNFGGRRR